MGFTLGDWWYYEAEIKHIDHTKQCEEYRAFEAAHLWKLWLSDAAIRDTECQDKDDVVGRA